MASIIRHQKQLVIGNYINMLLFGFLWSVSAGEANPLYRLRSEFENNPAWVGNLIRDNVTSSSEFFLPKSFTWSRWRRLKGLSLLRKIAAFPVVFGGWIFDFYVARISEEFFAEVKASASGDRKDTAVSRLCPTFSDGRRGSTAHILMKVVILAGGLGTRLTEETVSRPKPMVEIGGRPILWHIMKLYAHFGFKEFVVALGYKGDVIKRYFLDYAKLESNFTVNLASGDVMRRGGQPQDSTVRPREYGRRNQYRRPAQETGMGSGSRNVDRRLLSISVFGDRLERVSPVPPAPWKAGDQLLAVRPPARFGGLVFDGDWIVEFTEKPQVGEGLMSGRISFP